ncbi:carbohydrate ABC transporter permease [Salipaludibacillus sp. HK11]|uniref:carbohydrate ABC transporter permease n=1 Tax=Salipaludibacillus sp. HK11 TaxID=3394320 RepID=UPI0039FCE218
MFGKISRLKLISIEVILFICAILFFVPFYFVIVNSFKGLDEVLTNTAALPQYITFENFIIVWGQLDFLRVIMNTIIITLFSNIGVIIISSMAAYWLVRKPSKFTSIIFILFVSSMVIPFQSIMIPIVQVMREIGLMNTHLGLIVTYIGLACSFSTFLFHGFIRSIPEEIEEAAMIDGCSRLAVFWRIIFPMLTPIISTVLILNTFWFWNDFQVQLVLLHSSELHTIQLAINSLFGEHVMRWELALPALMMGTLPAVIVFLFLQRYIIAGVSSGAVKG